MAAVHTAVWASNQLVQRQLCSHVMQVCCRQQQSGQNDFLGRALCCHCLVFINSSAFLHPAAPGGPLCTLCSWGPQYSPAREQCFSEMCLPSVQLWCRITESDCFPLVRQSFWWGCHLWKMSTFQPLFSLCFGSLFSHILLINNKKKASLFLFFSGRNSDLEYMDSV